MMRIKFNSYPRRLFVTAAALLFIVSAAGCAGQMRFDGNGDVSVPIRLTLATDESRGCWIATFSVVNAGDTLPEIDQSSVAASISITDGVSSTVWWNDAGDQATICAAMSWCADYEIAFAEGVIADADGDAFTELTLPTANKEIVRPDNPGDYDGDCFADFLTGDFTNDTDKGLARLYFGDADPAAGLAFAENAPAAVNARFGNAVVMTDKTGVTHGGGIDLLIGARTTAFGGQPNVGMVYLNDVVGAGLTDILNVRGTVAEQRLGFHVGYLGDVDGDGSGDFAAAGRGAPGDPDASREPYLFLGPWVADKASSDADAVLKNDFNPAHLNISLKIKGADLDGDGTDDIFVSAGSTDPLDLTTAVWKLYFYRGGQAFSGDVAPTSFLWGGGTNYNGFGYIFDFGDFNGDGQDDLLVAAIDAEVTNFAPLEVTLNYGAAFIFFGPLPMNGQLTYEDADVAISADDEIMGFHVANLGDINGNGMHDIGIVSLIEPNAAGFPDARTYVYFGRQSWDQYYDKAGADLVISDAVNPLTLNMDSTIYAVAGVGDVDNDGHDDIVVAAVEKADNRASLYLFLGKDMVSGADLDLGDAALNIVSPSALSLVHMTGMMSVGGIYSEFEQSLYPMEDFKPDPEPPPKPPPRE